MRSLLTGTVQRAGDKLRISVEPIDTEQRRAIVVAAFRSQLRRICSPWKMTFQTQSAQRWRSNLARRRASRWSRPRTDNPHAHDLYLRAKELVLSQRRTQPEPGRQPVQPGDRGGSQLRGSVGRAGVYLYFLADAYRAPIDLLPVMKAAAEKAVALDPKLQRVTPT